VGEGKRACSKRLTARRAGCSHPGSPERVLPKGACLCLAQRLNHGEGALCSFTCIIIRNSRKINRALINVGCSSLHLESSTKNARRLYLHRCLRSLAIQYRRYCQYSRDREM